MRILGHQPAKSKQSWKGNTSASLGICEPDCRCRIILRTETFWNTAVVILAFRWNCFWAGSHVFSNFLESQTNISSGRRTETKSIRTVEWTTTKHVSCCALSLRVRRAHAVLCACQYFKVYRPMYPQLVSNGRGGWCAVGAAAWKPSRIMTTTRYEMYKTCLLLFPKTFAIQAIHKNCH